MAEQLAFEQRLGDGPCIDGDHRFLAPEAVGVDLTRQHVLAGTVLSGDQDRRIGRGDLVQRLPDVLHGRGCAPEHGAVRFLVKRRMSVPFQGLPCLVPGGGQYLDQLVVVPGLHDEVEGSPLHPFHGQGDVGVSGEQYDFHLRHHFLDFTRPVKPFVARIDVCVEVHVQKHHIRPELLQRRNERGRRRYRLHLGEVKGQQYLQRPANALVIIYDQYFPNLGSHCQISLLRTYTSQIPFQTAQHAYSQALAFQSARVKP